MKMKILILLILIFTFWNTVYSVPITVGLVQPDDGSLEQGYVLFAPMYSTNTYLIDKCGYVVHQWIGKYRPGLSVYLLPNGKLLKTGTDEVSPFKNGGGGGIIEIVDWDGNVEWRYSLITLTECQHHDVKYMPNGNILAISWDKKSLEEITIAGRDPKSFNKMFCSEQIKELRPIGKDSAEIVWEWKVWDHLVQDFDSTKENYDKVELHPELIDANSGSVTAGFDWQHTNFVDYNPEFDQILLSVRHFNEVWIIDHSTTKAEAAEHKGGKYGKGGDLLYRWGNPAAYRHGTATDQQLFFQHNAHWITEGLPYAGCIMLFNNLRNENDIKYSSVDIIKPPINSEGFYSSELPYAPTKTEWSYTAPKPSDFLAVNLSSVQMLNKSNVLICNGPKGEFFVLDSSKNIVWKYVNPVGTGGIIKQGIQPKMNNNVFHCTFYPSDYAGLVGKDLTRIGLIENENQNSESCKIVSVEKTTNFPDYYIYFDPSWDYITIGIENISFSVEIFDINGMKMLTAKNKNTICTKELSNGIYFINLITDSGDITSKKFIIKR
ncbi:MAG: aryl-sulfate sulfotransferase [bacterium]